MLLLSQASSVVTRVWPAPSGGTVTSYPELQIPDIASRPNIGICFSGGGARALSATIGQIRALEANGALDDVRYISCVSGGSWASTPFTYYLKSPSNDDQFLTPYVAPNDLQLSTLNDSFPSDSLPWTATQDFLWTLADTYWNVSDDHEIWAYLIGRLFLHPFGNFNWDQAKSNPAALAYFSWDANTVAGIRNRNPNNLHVRSANFYTARAKRPYLIVNSCIIPNKDALNQELVPFQYTPLYAGMPSQVSSGGKTYGGGFLEPFAFGGNGPTQPISGGTATVQQPPVPFTLADASGTSSSAYAQEILQTIGDGSYDPRRVTWTFGLGNSSRETMFGDGGLIENCGIIPLLARGTKFLYAFVNTETPLSLTYDPNTTVGGADPNGLIDVSLPALFGLSNPNWSWWYPNNHVFPTDCYVPFVQELQQFKKAGQQPFAFTQLPVLPNKWWGLTGGYDAIVAWIYLDHAPHWESQLHPDIRRMIGKKGTRFVRFPNYLTISENYEGSVLLYSDQVRMLSQMTDWVMRANRDRFAGMHAEAAAGG